MVDVKVDKSAVDWVAWMADAKVNKKVSKLESWKG